PLAPRRGRIWQEMAPPGEKLTGRQAAALAALLSEPTVQAAAARAGVGERTLLRWLKDPGFRREYRAARSAAVEHAAGALQRACLPAPAGRHTNTRRPRRPGRRRGAGRRGGGRLLPDGGILPQ